MLTTLRERASTYRCNNGQYRESEIVNLTTTFLLFYPLSKHAHLLLSALHTTILLGDWIGCRTGNGGKLSNS